MNLTDTREHYEIQDADGNALSSIDVNSFVPGITLLPSVHLAYSIGDGYTAHGGALCAFGDQIVMDPTTNALGKEALDEAWLEAKTATGEWTPLNATTRLVLTAESQDIDLRFNVPADAATKGFFRIYLVALFGPNGAPTA